MQFDIILTNASEVMELPEEKENMQYKFKPILIYAIDPTTMIQKWIDLI